MEPIVIDYKALKAEIEAKHLEEFRVKMDSVSHYLVHSAKRLVHRITEALLINVLEAGDRFSPLYVGEVARRCFCAPQEVTRMNWSIRKACPHITLRSIERRKVQYRIHDALYDELLRSPWFEPVQVQFVANGLVNVSHLMFEMPNCFSFLGRITMPCLENAVKTAFEMALGPDLLHLSHGGAMEHFYQILTRQVTKPFLTEMWSYVAEKRREERQFLESEKSETIGTSAELVGLQLT
jgi:hypothetical protein